MTKDKNLEDFLPNKNGSYYKEFNNNHFLNNIIIQEDVIRCIKNCNGSRNSSKFI